VTAVVTSAWTMLAGLGGALPSLVLHPRGTDVAAHGLRRRNGLVRGRWVPWDDVVAVEPPGRWRDHGAARLRDGRVLDLVGMAPDDVVRLAAALAEARAEPGGARGRPRLTNGRFLGAGTCRPSVSSRDLSRP